MKNCFAVLCLFLGLITRAQDKTEMIALSERKSFLQIYKTDNAGSESNNNVTYQRLEISVDPAVNFIAGKVTTYFIPDSDLNTIEFDLTDILLVDSVIFHNAPVNYTHTGDVIHINLPVTLLAGQVDSIAVSYHGVPSNTGFGSFVQTTHGADSIPIMWTLSEPYGAKDWWPCKQDLQDKIDSIDVIITAPPQYNVASNGLLVQEAYLGNNKISHWKHRYPIATYLVCFAVTNYNIYYEHVPYGGDTLPVAVYVYPEKYDIAHPQTPLIVPIMQTYDSLFGLYAFSKEKYGLIEFGWGGGMEHQTSTFCYNWDFDLVAHELAHHWFGDKVTCASWHDIWLNEGFAVWVNALAYRYVAPIWYPVAKRGSLGAALTEPHGSVWCDDTTSVDRIFSSHLTYNKGAMILHNLEFTLGDSIMFTALRNYLTDPNRAYSFAATSDLKAHLEETSGKDLTDFFNEWVYGKGFPSYQFIWSQDFSNRVTVTVVQTQSDASVPFFHTPLPLQFKNTTGGDTMIIINPGASGQSFSFDVPFAADSLIFDPETWVLAGFNTITRLPAYDFSFDIYPNPVVNEAKLRFESKEERSAEIKVYNEVGQLVWKNSTNVSVGTSFMNINTQQFQAGMYHMKVTAGNQSLTRDFVVLDQKKK